MWFSTDAALPDLVKMHESSLMPGEMINVCVPDVRIFGHQSGDFQEQQCGVSQFEHFSNGSDGTTKSVCVFTLNTTIKQVRRAPPTSTGFGFITSQVLHHVYTTTEATILHQSRNWVCSATVLLCTRTCFDSFSIIDGLLCTVVGQLNTVAVHKNQYIPTHSSQFFEEELELISLFDHPLSSLLPLISILKGDPLLHHCFNVLHHYPSQGLARHLLHTAQPVCLTII